MHGFQKGWRILVLLLLAGGMALGTEPEAESPEQKTEEQIEKERMEELRKEMQKLREKMKEQGEEVRNYAEDPAEAWRIRDGRNPGARFRNRAQVAPPPAVSQQAGGMALGTEPEAESPEQKTEEQIEKERMEVSRKDMQQLRELMKEYEDEVRNYAEGPPEALRSRDGRSALRNPRGSPRYRAQVAPPPAVSQQAGAMAGVLGFVGRLWASGGRMFREAVPVLRAWLETGTQEEVPPAPAPAPSAPQ